MIKNSNNEVKHIQSFKEHRENLNSETSSSTSDDRYSVIGRWTEPDGTEEWDVIHNGPLTYDEALKVAVDAGRAWDKNIPSDRKNIPHIHSTNY